MDTSKMLDLSQIRTDLLEKRKSLKASRNQVAKVSGINERTIRAIENAEPNCNPTVETINAISRALESIEKESNQTEQSA